jgi:hypothetical protein
VRGAGAPKEIIPLYLGALEDEPAVAAAFAEIS